MGKENNWIVLLAELKKLVYLYLMNYAKSQPDMAIMAVNTFVKENWIKYNNDRLKKWVLSYYNLYQKNNMSYIICRLKKKTDVRSLWKVQY